MLNAFYKCLIFHHVIDFWRLMCFFVGLDLDDFDQDERSDKIKNPNNIQGGKWQLGFQGEQSIFLALHFKTKSVFWESNISENCLPFHVHTREQARPKQRPGQTLMTSDMTLIKSVKAGKVELVCLTAYKCALTIARFIAELYSFFVLPCVWSNLTLFFYC